MNIYIFVDKFYFMHKTVLIIPRKRTLYPIGAELKGTFSKENFKRFLMQGSKVGFQYFEYGSEKGLNPLS